MKSTFCWGFLPFLAGQTIFNPPTPSLGDTKAAPPEAKGLAGARRLRDVPGKPRWFDLRYDQMRLTMLWMIKIWSSCVYLQGYLSKIVNMDAYVCMKHTEYMSLSATCNMYKCNCAVRPMLALHHLTCGNLHRKWWGMISCFVADDISTLRRHWWITWADLRRLQYRKKTSVSSKCLNNFPSCPFLMDTLQRKSSLLVWWEHGSHGPFSNGPAFSWLKDCPAAPALRGISQTPPAPAKHKHSSSDKTSRTEPKWVP